MGRRWCTVITQRRQIYVWLRDGDVSRTCALDHAARASLAAMRNSGTALQRDFSSAAAAWAAGLDEGGSKRSRKGSVPAWRVRRLGGVASAHGCAPCKDVSGWQPNRSWVALQTQPKGCVQGRGECWLVLVDVWCLVSREREGRRCDVCG